MAFGISGFGARQTYPSPQAFQALSLGNSIPVPPNPPYGNPNENLVPVARTGNPAFNANLTLVAHPTFQAILKVTTAQTANQVQTLVTQPGNPADVLQAVNTVLSSGPPTEHSTNATTLLTQGRPQLPPVVNTTSSVLAPNPTVAGQVQGASTSGLQPTIDLPQGPVSFQLLVAPASVGSGAAALTQTVNELEQGLRQAQQAPAPSTNSQGNGNAAQSAPGASAPQPGASDPPPAGSAPQSAPAPTTPAPASPTLVGRLVQTVTALAVAAVYPGPVFSFSA